MTISRRHFLAGASLAPATLAIAKDMPKGWTKSAASAENLPVWSYGSGPAVLLMHEINGLSPTDIACGESIAREGSFQVYMPLLFGSPNGEHKLAGLFQSCGSRGFDCSH